ncbi:MAG: hypothetical protein PHV82_15160, partial [Victivallaceae bacterium]|nr:hypothetical protein [Victivallaceae bacterium]
IEKHYPYMKKYFVVKNPDGTEEVRTDELFKPDFLGFFALLAAEMGDEETKNKLLERADKLYSPIWKDGTYHYEYFNTSYAFGAKPAENKEKTAKGCCASKDKPHVVVPMGSLGLGKCCKDRFQNDNVQDRLFGMTRALPKNGLWKMYNEPFDKQHFSEPALTGVDMKTAVLKRAVYDRAKKALIVSTLGSGNGGVADFKIKNLDPGKNYILKDKGNTVAEFSGVKEYNIKFNNKVSHDFILWEANGSR